MTSSSSNGKFANFFGLVFLFGLFLLMICIYREEEIILLMVTKPMTVESLAELSDLSDKDQPIVGNENSEEKFDFPILEGWPPGKSLNISEYIQPEEDTTLIVPKLTFGEISGENEESQKKRILIVCQSSFTQSGYELRQSIRKTWAAKKSVTSETSNTSETLETLKSSNVFPVSVVFLFGTTKNDSAQNDLEKESEEFGDILQGNFVDSYNNLTLKSMFMLKFATEIVDSIPFGFLLKVDDDSFVNLKALTKYSTVLARFQKTIVGHVLGEDNPVNRAAENSTEKFVPKWHLPHYIYPKKETFPNAVSGSGYLLKSEDLDCMYRRGLETPFVNLEDIFITGLVARQCRLKLRSHPKFYFMGKKDFCHNDFHQDIVIHEVKDPKRMQDLNDLFQGKKNCEDLSK